MSFSPKTGGPVVPSVFSLCDAFAGLRSRSEIRRFRRTFVAEDITGVVKAPVLVSFVEPGRALGCFDLLFKEVRIALDEPEAMLATLSHELTHALEFMAFKQWAVEAFRYDAELPYHHRLAEGRAEAVAQAVAHYLSGSDPYGDSPVGIEVCRVQLGAAMWLYKSQQHVLMDLLKNLKALR